MRQEDHEPSAPAPAQRGGPRLLRRAFSG
jgi:hypothetical protein